MLRRRRLGQSLTQEGSSGQVRYGSLTSPKARDSVTSIRRGFVADLLYTTSRESPRQIEVLEIERKRLAYRRRSATYRRLAVSRGGEDKAWPFPRCSQTDGRDDAAADAASLLGLISFGRPLSSPTGAPRCRARAREPGDAARN